MSTSTAKYRVTLQYLTGTLAGLVISEITTVPREVGKTYKAAVTDNLYIILSVEAL